MFRPDVPRLNDLRAAEQRVPCVLLHVVDQILLARQWRLCDGHALSGQHGLVEDAVAGQQDRVALHGAAGRRDFQDVAGHEVFGVNGGAAVVLELHRRRVGAEDGGMQRLLIFQSLSDGEEDAEGRHEDDDAGVVVIVVGEPEDHGEHLEHVERVERLEEQQLDPAFDRHVDLIVAVHQTPETKTPIKTSLSETSRKVKPDVPGEARDRLLLVDRQTRHVHVQPLQLGEAHRLGVPHVAQLLAIEVTNRFDTFKKVKI